eukprot:scaffold256_cov102-Skeletonema_dohrnii-CCMP3373.AAC.1
MKFIVSSAVLLSAIPGAFSAELEPHLLRGPVAVAVSYDSCSNDNSNPYLKGKSEGECEANKIWDNEYGSNGCKRISSYNTEINYYISKHYNSDYYSGTTKSEMNGATDGMKYVMKQKDSQCATSSYSVDIYSCRTVGIYSATQIAQRKCNSSSGSFKYPNKSQLGDMKDCYTIADDDCQGNIDQMIQTYCSNGRSNDYDFLKQLKAMCVNEVSKHLN